jgi:hypothetical protein
MVVITRKLLELQAGRRLVRSLGVREEQLRHCEAVNEGVDWAAMMHSLDGVFVHRGGAMGQVRFLREPREELGGRCAGEALLERGGPERVQRAASRFASE